MGGKRSILSRLLLMAWEHRWLCLTSLVWSLGVQVLLLSGFIFSGLAIDLVRQADHPGDANSIRWPLGLSPPDDASLISKILLASGLVLAFTLVRSFGNYGSRMADERLVQRIIVNLRVRLYDRLQRMSFSYFDQQDSGTLINRVTGDAASVRLFIQNVIIRMAVTAATLVLFVGYLLHEHALLTLSVISVVPFQVLVVRRYAVRIRPQFLAMRQSMDRLIQALQESILGVRVVRGFGQEQQIVDKLNERNEQARQRRMDIVNTSGTYMPAVPAVNFIQLSILLGYGGYLVYLGPESGGIALGTMWVFLGLIRQLSGHVDRIVQSASTIPEAMTGAQRVFELLDTPIEIASPNEGNGYAESLQGRIEFQDVSFAYGSEGDALEPVLENVSLRIEPGETVAIVGPAGAGKTTLLNLIGRFYDATSGHVLVDDVDVRACDLVSLRRQIGYAMQEPFLFSNSISKNIAFGEREASGEFIRHVAGEASAISFIDDKERQFGTIVGERGLNLSGGERQRLSLARSLLTRPPILLLDDATSSVDARTEVEIQGALEDVMRDRTTIIVAHRLSALRKADRIIVLERGQITAIGTHDELMKKNEHYRQAAMIQLEAEESKDEEMPAEVGGGEGGVVK